MSSASTSSISSSVVIFYTGAEAGVATRVFLLLSAFSRCAFCGCFVFVEATESDVAAVGVHVDLDTNGRTSCRNSTGAGVDL